MTPRFHQIICSTEGPSVGERHRGGVRQSSAIRHVIPSANKNTQTRFEARLACREYAHFDTVLYGRLVVETVQGGTWSSLYVILYVWIYACCSIATERLPDFAAQSPAAQFRTNPSRSPFADVPLVRCCPHCRGLTVKFNRNFRWKGTRALRWTAVELHVPVPTVWYDTVSVPVRSRYDIQGSSASMDTFLLTLSLPDLSGTTSVSV